MNWKVISCCWRNWRSESSDNKACSLQRGRFFRLQICSNVMFPMIHGFVSTPARMMEKVHLRSSMASESNVVAAYERNTTPPKKLKGFNNNNLVLLVLVIALSHVNNLWGKGFQLSKALCINIFFTTLFTLQICQLQEELHFTDFEKRKDR